MTAASVALLVDRLIHRTITIEPVDDSADRVLLAYEELALALERKGEISGDEVYSIVARWATDLDEADEMYEFLTDYLL